MKTSLLQMKRALQAALIVLLLSVVGMMKTMAQTPYRQYSDNGILLDFHKIDNVDFRVFLLYNLSQDDQFILTENEEFGQFSINPNEEEDNLAFYDAFEKFYQYNYTDFQLLSKMDITEQLPQWKSLVAPQHFTSIMMDVTLRRSRSGENERCFNATQVCTSDFYEYEAASTNQTADQLEGYPIDDGCIHTSYNPSWYYLKIADPGPLTIHMEGHDPDNPSTQRDIDFCLWGPYTEEQFYTGWACQHLTTDKIIDCSYSASYLEDAFMGYPVGEHQHSSPGHGTVNYHVPQTGEYYLLMITNFSRQPCVITFNKPDETEPGTTDCGIHFVVDNDGPYCVGETIYLRADYAPSGCSYSWTGPNNFRSRYQNPVRSNCTMAMAGPYVCTITKNGQSASDTTWVEVYPTPVANFTATTVSLGNATQFTSTSTTTPPEYTDSIPSYEWDFGDGYTGSGAMASHYYGQAGTYQVTFTITTGGHCTDEITQTVTVNQNPTGIIPFADVNVKDLCVANWDTNGDGELSFAEAAAVTNLGEVFKNNNTITSFNELGYFRGLTSIGNNAFYYCYNLTSIGIPNTVTAISENAFYYCYNLASIEMPSSMTSIGNYAFYYCDRLTSINIPSSVTSIGNYAFYHCNRLTTLRLPGSLTAIGNNAFQYCTGLTSIEIPNSVTTIGNYAFSNCIGLTSIAISNSVTSISSYVFNYCTGLTSIEIPSSVTTIGNSAFSNCTGLTSISISNSVTTIGDSAFSNCTGLTSISIPNSVTTIGNSAFSNCTGLTSISIPNSVTTIGNSAFSNCTGLTSIAISNSLTTVGDSAFSNCTGLTSIVIPNTVTSIGINPFIGCSGLGRIVVASGNTSYDSRGNCNAIIHTSSNTLITGCKNTVIPTSVTSINNSAFYNCTSLTSLEIPYSVTSIGNYAFNNCTGLATIVSLAEIPPTLGNYAFFNVDKSIPVYVPFGRVSVYQSASGWNEFTNILEYGPVSISFADANVKSLCVANWDTNGDGELSYAEAAAVASLGEVFKNKSSITSFNELRYFIGLTSIGNNAFYYCTGLTSIVIPNSVTSISGNAFYYCTGLTSIEIPSSVTSIGQSAFYYCTGLTSIEIPNSVTSIGYDAFYYCTGLTSIEIPNSVTSIGSSAFSFCTGLTSIEIPSSVTSIGTNPFSGCSNLGQIVVASGNTYYDSRENCDAIIHTSSNALVTGCKNTIIPNTVTSISSYAFYYCTGLTSIEIPNSVTSIGNYAFYYCTGLTSIVIPNSVTSIGSSAFSSCTGLTSIEIPNSVTSIGSSAFEGCRGLRFLNALPETPPSMGSRVFYDVSPAIPVYVPCNAVENYQAAYGWSGFNNITGMCSGMVSALANPSNGGTVTGAGNYNGGEVCVLTATSNQGYVFGNWTENGMVVSENPVFSFRAHPTTMVANFCSTNPIVFADANVKALCVANWDTNVDGELSFAEAAAVTDLGSVFKNKSITSFNELRYFIRLTSIGNNAFYYCTGLTSIAIPNSVTMIGSSAFDHCTGLTSIAIPNSVTMIGSSAFYYCIGLTSIEIPNSVTSIGSYAFSSCTGLTSVEIPNSVTSISSYAFNYCTGLISIEIPNSVTYLYDGAFSNCRNITSIVCLAETPPALGNYVFSNVSNIIPVYVPCDAVEAYHTSNGWNGFTSIIGLCSGDVSVVVNPSNGGTVTGAGNYNGGEVCVLTATPNQGYVFGNWTENGRVVSTETVYSFYAHPTTIVANFCTSVSVGSFVTECDSYTWNGETYDATGDYQQTFTTALGCDSIVTLHLTINQSEAEEFTETACDAFTWHGTQYTTSGNYTFETETAQGCQRIETLHLTINQGEAEEYTVSACDTYTWSDGDGQTYTTSGDYVFNTTTPEGCDKTVTLHLTISESVTEETSATACDYYTWHGTTYTQSGTYYYNTTTYNGCSRTEILHLTINQSEEEWEFVTECDQYTWHGMVITQSGTYDYETTTPEGCSRIEHLNITIPYSEVEEYTITANDSYTWHGTTYTQSGTYYYETTTNEGCPHIEVLHLTIETNHWTPVGEGSSPFSMTLYGVIQIDGVEQYSNQLELGIFCGNECRGTAIANEFFLTHRYLVEANVYGDSGDQLTFKLYDHATHQELELTSPDAITFTIDGYGNPVNPYVLNFTSSMSITATTAPEGAGIVTGTGEYTIGSTCTLTATANTGFQFQNWTLNGTVVSTNPNYTFTVTGAANYVAHFQYVQSRTLVSGWNWWSTYIEQEGNNGLEMLENSLGTSGIRIQGKNNSVDYFEYQGAGYWYGSLNTIANEQMYMIRTNAACDAVIVGDAAQPANHPITINGGWNWIGYPSSQSVDVNVAMSSFTPEANDVVKGRNSVSTYISYGGYQGWYGQLNTLEPGQGYMYRSYSDATKTLTFQTGRGGETLANITPENNVFVPNTANYADNMIVTAVIDMDGEELRSEDYELAVFVGNECRGSVRLMYVEPFDRYVALLMAYGEGEEELRFVLTDGQGIGWSNDRVTYTANGTVGTMTDPAVLHFGPLGIEDNILKSIHVYPNPSKDIFNIEGEGIQKIEVVDIYGQVVLSKEVKNTNVQVDLSDKAVGAYLLRVVTDGGVVTHKLIKNN